MPEIEIEEIDELDQEVDIEPTRLILFSPGQLELIHRERVAIAKLLKQVIKTTIAKQDYPLTYKAMNYK